MMRRYTETYDLNTRLNTMTILAIHTPQADALKKMFKGHFLNFKKYKVLGCDIKMACASGLPLNPEEVGMEAGQMDPRDVMNPMLFKACTGENLNALLNQIYNKSEETQDGHVLGTGSVGQHEVDETSSMNAYYQLLADPTFRKAHPQQGIQIKNLKPFVHKVATTQPMKWIGVSKNEYPKITTTGNNPSASTETPVGWGSPSGNELNAYGNWDTVNPTVFVSNGIEPMPWLDTAVPQSKTIKTTEGTATTQMNWIINGVPRVYMGALILPPGLTTKWYLRMMISWRIAFREWRPAYEIGSINALEIIDGENGINGTANGTNSTYFNYYNDESTKDIMEREDSSFTSNGTDNVDMIVTG